MLQVFSLGFWLFLMLSCPLWFAGALLIYALTVPFDRHRRLLLHLYTSAWAVSYFYLTPFWRLRVRGRSKLPWRGPAVLVSNHASLIDILALFGLFRPFKWVSKRSVFKVPCIGWNMSLNGYIQLTRGDKDSIARMMKQARACLDAGVPVFIFPEGTRTRDGNLLPFKEGAFRLALEAGCPVIPIAVHGTGDALPKHGITLRKQTKALVEVLDPMDPGHFGTPAAMAEAARATIGRALSARQQPAFEPAPLAPTVG
jgi:1-acyl-sn-glycerol-3-phosphate acyltransferase